MKSGDLKLCYITVYVWRGMIWCLLSTVNYRKQSLCFQAISRVLAHRLGWAGSSALCRISVIQKELLGSIFYISQNIQYSCSHCFLLERALLYQQHPHILLSFLFQRRNYFGIATSSFISPMETKIRSLFLFPSLTHFPTRTELFPFHSAWNSPISRDFKEELPVGPGMFQPVPVQDLLCHCQWHTLQWAVTGTQGNLVLHEEEFQGDWFCEHR